MELSQLLNNTCTTAGVGVIVLGVGHSGTSTVACELHRLGFFFRGGMRTCEDSGVVELNERMARTLKLHQRRVDNFSEIEQFVNTNPRPSARFAMDASRHISRLPVPFIIKDPRFVWTLHHWTPLFKRLPMLIHVRRDAGDILKSHVARKEMVTRADVRTRQLWDAWQLSQWPGCAVSFSVYDLSTHVPRSNKHGRRHRS